MHSFSMAFYFIDLFIRNSLNISEIGKVAYAVTEDLQAVMEGFYGNGSHIPGHEGFVLPYQVHFHGRCTGITVLIGKNIVESFL